MNHRYTLQQTGRLQWLQILVDDLVAIHSDKGTQWLDPLGSHESFPCDFYGYIYLQYIYMYAFSINIYICMYKYIYIWATVNIWYIAPSHHFLKSVLSFFRFWYISKCYRFWRVYFSFSKPQLNFQKIETAWILLSINLNFGCSS